MANEYLKRTPTSTGNRKVWTWAGWIKRNQISSDSFIFSAGSLASNWGGIHLNATRGVGLLDVVSSTQLQVQTVEARRDASSWLNVVVSVDTTKENSQDRVKMYVNGVNLTDFQSHTATQNYNTWTNSLTMHGVGRLYDGANPFATESEMFDIFLVDGQALTPDVFGFYKEGKGYQSSGTSEATDFRPGQWSPHSPRKIKTEIERRGGFGVNGFYLPMNDSSNFGADFHCTPNSIIKLKGEDLPQPRNGAPTTSDAYVSQLRSDPYASNLVLAVPGVELENTNPELVTNGDFSNGTTGWTGLSGGSLSVEDGKLKITETTGAVDAYAVNSTAITTVVGRRYTIKWTFHEGTNTTFTVRFGNSGNQSQEYQSNTGANGYGSYPDPGTYSFTFTATATTLNLSFIVNQASSYGYLSNVSVKEAVAVRDYSADIKGSGTNKTVTGVGLAGVYPVPSYYGSAMRFGNDGTNGAGNTDIINVPTSSDFVFNGDVTIECWMYVKSTPSTSAAFLGQWQSNGGTNRNIMMYFDTSNRVTSYFNSGGSNYNTGSSPALALNQWHHIATEKDGDKFRLYVNGVCVGIRATTPTAGNTAAISFTIGAETESGGTTTGADYGLDGYIQDVRVYKGVAKYKGGFDVLKPYTPVGIETWRQVPDTCKNNFATWNPLLGPQGCTLADGNLTVTSDGVNNHKGTRSTMGMSSGKWYWEYRVGTVALNSYVGVSEKLTPDGLSGSNYIVSGQGVNNYVSPNGSFSVTDSSMTTGMIIGCAFDRDASTQQLKVYKNGSLAVTGTSSDLGDGVIYLAHNSFNAAVSDGWEGNFGQNPTFSGTTTAGTYTDSNGKGLFKYQPPAGYLALCEDNLPTPAIADPGKHMKTVLYTGDGTGEHSITGVGFKPDLVWIKCRDNAKWHALVDSVRGNTKTLYPNDQSVEITETHVSSFDSNGFTVADIDSGTANEPNFKYVAWCWKAGGAAVSNTDGSLTTQVSVNQDAGFSIGTFTGARANTQTIGHGLGKVPSMIIVKERTGNSGWAVYHKSRGNTKVSYLNYTDAEYTETGDTSSWNATDPTSSVFSVGKNGATNDNTLVFYAWAEIDGYSKFGSYTGNGSADGTFVYCGFKPAFLMIKRVNATGEWWMYDNSRGPTNPIPRMLMADSASAEQEDSASYLLDFLSNGFKWRSGLAASNGTSGSFIFMAFAESPFQTANAK